MRTSHPELYAAPRAGPRVAYGGSRPHDPRRSVPAVNTPPAGVRTTEEYAYWTRPCFLCGGPWTGMKPHANDCPWQTGKLDVECAECGVREAASTRCSACLHPHSEDDYRLHSDPRALHHSSGSPTRRSRPAISPVTPRSGTDDREAAGMMRYPSTDVLDAPWRHAVYPTGSVWRCRSVVCLFSGSQERAMAHVVRNQFGVRPGPLTGGGGESYLSRDDGGSVGRSAT